MCSNEVDEEEGGYLLMEGKQLHCVWEDQQVVPVMVVDTRQVTDSHLLL